VITSPIGSIRPARDTSAPGSSTTSGSASGSASDASNAITQAAGGTMGKDQFVQLLVTEMKNQDPMNPMDGKDLAAQLAQFSSVEQLMNINTKLDNFAALFAPPPATGTASSSGPTTQGA
jgi:flagellar basal-body rod modification protein FlgD